MAERPRIWDAIVVGGGPAGCAAAYDLACAGRSVLVLDRCSFPRMKACAGGLTMKAVRALRYSIAPAVRQTIYGMQLSRRYERKTLLRSRQPICVLTVREELDAFCMEETLSVGAQFRRCKHIRFLAELPDGVELSTGDEIIRGRYLVGADGANSRVRQLLGGDAWFSRGFALETQVPIKPKSEVMDLDFGVIRDGYGWIFPKGDHVSAGLYSASLQDSPNRAMLARYVREKLGTESVGPVLGQYLGMGANCGGGRVPQRVLLAGDAAGMVDPLSGEGIYYAIISGQAAAQAVSAGLADGVINVGECYRELLCKPKLELDLCTRAARKFYGNLEMGFRALTLPLIRKLTVNTLANGLSYSRAVKRCWPVVRHFDPNWPEPV